MAAATAIAVRPLADPTDRALVVRELVLGLMARCQDAERVRQHVEEQCTALRRHVRRLQRELRTVRAELELHRGSRAFGRTE